MVIFSKHRKEIYGLLICTASLTLTLNGCVTGTIGPACGSIETGNVPGNSLRVLTYNTQLMSPIFNFGEVELTNDSVDERAKKIAEILSNGYYDVMAFNEVWSEEDAKDNMHRLCETYPFWVKYIDILGGAMGGSGEDSGLMLYSKFPFQPLPDNKYKSEDSETSYGDDSDRVAFVRYDDCEGHDCKAAKGAMMVRLRHNGSQRTINMLTTHTQADEGGHFPTTRANQLSQIRATNFIDATNPGHLLGTTTGLLPNTHIYNWPNNEWILLTGDLNIKGEGAIGDAVYSTTVTTNHAGIDEWWNQFGEPAKRSLTSALYDPWAESSSIADKGLTSRGGSRLDYILASRRNAPLTWGAPPVPDLCVQHIWNPPELEGLSDHRAVAADINLEAIQCNPRIAYTPSDQEMGVIGTSQERVAKKLYRELQYPGSMQWFRLNEPGTYLVGFDAVSHQAGVGPEFYEESNLSVPVHGGFDLGVDTMLVCDDISGHPTFDGGCQGTSGYRIKMTKPGFIRVFNKSRQFSGNYWIAIHKYTCKSKTEACQLLPNYPESFSFPTAGTPLNPNDSNFPDSAWFKVEIHNQATSGQKQSLRFYVENNMANEWNPPTIELLDASASNVLSNINGDNLTATDTTSSNGQSLRAIDGMSNQDDDYYLRVSRASINDSLQFHAGWQTDLSLLGGLKVGGFGAELVCNDETNPEYGHDEISLQIKVDGASWQTRGSKDFDCNDADEQWPWDDHIGVIRFLDSVQIRLVEADDGNPDDKSGANSFSWPQEINLSDPDTKTRFSTRFKFEGGEYHFNFNLGKILRN